jgi:hypothetical protein
MALSKNLTATEILVRLTRKHRKREQAALARLWAPLVERELALLRSRGFLPPLDKSEGTE